jgi:hypothetical protein
LRLGYIDDIFDETMSKIKLELSGKKVWVSIDETIDVEGRFVANVIVGVLEVDYPGKQYLVYSEQLEKQIIRLFTEYSTNLLESLVFNTRMFYCLHSTPLPI